MDIIPTVMSWACISSVSPVRSQQVLETYSLVVSEAECGQILVLKGKLLEVLDDLGELGKNEVQGTLLEDQVGVVGN
jgi:hypothetical protein